MNWRITEQGPAGSVALLLNRARNLMQLPLAAEVKEMHLTPQHAIMVLAVARACDAAAELTPAAAAERLGVDRPSLSAMLTKLVRMRWLATSPNPADGRSRTLHLGVVGTERIGDLRAATERAVERAVGCIPDEDLQRLAELLEEIIAAMERCAES